MAEGTDNRLGKVAIVFGASEFPHGGPRIADNQAFARSADGFMRYLRRESGLNLPFDNVLNLFNESSSVFDQDQKITDFLSEKKEAKDIIIYYVGHGGFLSDRDYFLALRSTRQHKEHLTGMQIKSLAESLQPLTAGRRLYLILDCCFAGEAVREFQTNELSTIIEKKTYENLPESGTSLLVAASKDEPAIAPADNPFTMFSESLLEVLQTGIVEKPSMLSLLDVGLQTRRLIESKYGLSAVRPEVHAPKQGGGLTVTVPLFPNPVGREKVPSFIPGVPLTVEAATKMLHAAPPAKIKMLHELFAIYSLHSTFYYEVTDVSEFLSHYQKAFDNPNIISQETAKQMFDEARERLASFVLTPDQQDYYTERMQLFDHVREPILSALPSREQCLTMIAETDKQLLIPFLVKQYFSSSANIARQHTRDLILECVERLSLGKELISIPEREITGVEPGDYEFQQTIVLARRILGAEFDQWYRSLRGQSYEEELRTYEQKQEERSRVEERRREEALQQALDEFRPKDGSVAPKLNRKQANMLIEKLASIIDELESRAEPPSDDLKASIHRAKYLLKKYSPDAAFRIHRAEILSDAPYLNSYGSNNDVGKDLISTTKRELAVVIEILEIDLAGSDFEPP
jgi:hypothetical protein